MHEQQISKVPSLHSLKNQNDISVTIHFYERNQKQTTWPSKQKDRTLLEYTADNIPLARKRTGRANRIFLEAEGYD